MQQYELLIVLPGTMAEDEAAAVKDQLAEIVTSQEAVNLTVEDRGKSRLAYPMKHIRYGYFYFFRFSAETTQVPVIQEKIRLTGKTLRSIVSKYSPELVEKNKEMIAKMVSTVAPAIDKEEEEEVEEVSVKPEKKAPEPTSAKVEVNEEVSLDTSEKVEEEKPKKKAAKKQPVTMEEIDEKLNEILDGSL